MTSDTTAHAEAGDWSAHIRVSGRVQGVYYRASTSEVARRLGLTGWVRNLPDGRVEAIAEGSRPSLERLVAWCREGPPAAVVTGVEVEWSRATGRYRGFDVRQ